MARYIDADALYVNVKAECNPYGKPTISFDDGCKVLDMIRRTPTEDVAPVMHAHWIFYANGTCDCSNCHTVWESNMLNRWIEYCPFCGAKMDEEAE